MVEEVGELAKAIRKYSGLKIDPKKDNYMNLEHETADVFIYLLHLAQKLDYNLLKVFKKKEEINSK